MSEKFSGGATVQFYRDASTLRDDRVDGMNQGERRVETSTDKEATRKSTSALTGDCSVGWPGSSLSRSTVTHVGDPEDQNQDERAALVRHGMRGQFR
jgi:hypothetical protein